MNKLRDLFAVISLVALTGMTGCASPRSATAGADAVPLEVSASAKAEAPTRFETAPEDDDFWGTGESMALDEDGRLVYAGRIELVEGRGINDAAHAPRGHYDPHAVYIDPLTGRRILLNQGPGTWRRVPRTVVVPPSEPTVSNAPQVSTPRPASSRMDAPQRRRSSDRVLRRER